MAESSNESNSIDEESQEDRERALGTYKEQALFVPHRMQQVLINWVFMIASATLLLSFVAKQDQLRRVAAFGPFSAFDELGNWFSVLSAFCWLAGFLIVGNWLKRVGATRLGKFACFLKVVGMLFLNLQPIAGTMNDARLGVSAGPWWSNMVGIVILHSGNFTSCIDFYLTTPPGASKARGWLFHGNLPITGMWVYQSATGFLVVANFMTCSFGGRYAWAPIFRTASMSVMLCQFAGGSLNLLASVICTYWCDGFRDFGTAALA